MLNWTCKNTVLQFNGKYYTQLDGVAMGSPIAPLMADVFMNWLVDNVSKIGCSPQILRRYVDDIFCAFDSKDEMDKFFQNLNKVHSSLSFLKEVEADGQLTYLDVLLTKNEKGIETTIYRKITHQDCTTNGKACRQYNTKKVPYKACYIVPTKFAAHTN